MATTTVPFIRPLSLAELLDQAIALYRRNFLTFIGIIAIPYIPLGILQGLSSYLSTSSLVNVESTPDTVFTDPNYLLGMSGLFILGLIQFILVQGVATAALTRAIADNYTGRPVNILDAYRSVGPSWWRLVGALIASMLIVIATLIWTLIPCVGWFTGFGILFFIGAIVNPFIAPIVVMEKRGWFGAFRRAWDLGRSRFWWLVGFALILGLLSILLIQLPVYLIQWGAGMAFGEQADYQQQLLISNVLQIMVSVISGLLYLPLSLTAMTIVYFDLRVRSEGFDLALQAAGEFNEKVNIVSLAETSPPTQGSFISGMDFGYFILLTVGMIALYALLASTLVGLAALVMAGSY
jgi:hypothetical protein